MLVSSYLVNLLCAVVECRGAMSPPEAFIAEYTTPPNTRFARRFDMDPVNMSQSGIFSGENFNDNYRPSRRKRLFNIFPPLQASTANKLGQNELSSRTGIEENSVASKSGLQTTMNHVMSAIPDFFNSVSRVMTRNGFSDTFRMGRNIDDGYKEEGGGRNAHGDLLPVVYLNHGGGVEGYYMGTMNGRKIAAYEGIPYAEQPIGNRRFKPPVPKRPWTGVKKAQKPGNTCLQTHPLYFFRVTGDERCLFVNVYSPQIPHKNVTNQSFPILIFIHGGSFMYGSGNEYGPSYLLDNDVILVTFNYRLGALGFLSTGDLESPGNFGLKDQALLIKWVHTNAKSFGGDPNRITISGQSAGGVSSHLHLVANKITSLFQNGISLSGSGFGFWPLLTKDRASRLTNSLAKRLNCPSRSSADLIRCLKGISGSWITMMQLQLFDWIPFHPLVLFAPVVEPEGPTSYLTRWPEDAYKKQNVDRKPWIFGQTFKEGHFETYQLKLFMQAGNMAVNAKKYLPTILDYDYYTSDPDTGRISDALVNFYDGNQFKNGLSMDVISDMYTDRYFSNTLHKAIHAHSRIAPTKTYAYVYDFTGKYNLGELFGVPRSEWSSAHTEDIMMFFNSSSYHHGLSKRDVEYQLSEIMTNVLSNFVATGVPVYRDARNRGIELWDNAVDLLGSLTPQIRYLRFGSKVEMIDDPYNKRVKFWESLGIPL